LMTARAWLVGQRTYSVDDVLDDLRRGWTEGHTEFSDLVGQDIEGLMSAISARHPAVRFYVRGMGEDFTDVWLRQFESGRVVYAVGPFEVAEQ
jgi:hypothetical protein